MKFKPGDIAYHKHGSDPVTILEYTHIFDGVDNSEQGYLVTMEGWTGSQERPDRSLVTFEENMIAVTDQLDQARKARTNAIKEVRRWKEELRKLKETHERPT